LSSESSAGRGRFDMLKREVDLIEDPGIRAWFDMLDSLLKQRNNADARRDALLVPILSTGSLTLSADEGTRYDWLGMLPKW
jgi:hypothetical protein